MLTLKYNRKPENYTWPGFVDALASLLMVIIFVLMTENTAVITITNTYESSEYLFMK